MIYEIQGTIDTVFNTETVGSNNFQKRAVWLQTEENYPQTVNVEFTQDRTQNLDGFKAGERVKIGFALNGRKTTKDNTERVFNSVNGLSIQRI